MNRTTLLLAGVLVVLILVAFLLLQKPGEQSSSASTGEFLATIDSLAVDKIHLQSPTLDVVLEKQGVEWYLRNPLSFRADQANVAQLLHQVKSLVVEGILSSLAGFQGDDFIDTPPASLPRVSAMLSFTGTQMVFYHVKEGDNYMVRSSRSPQWYDVSSWR